MANYIITGIQQVGIGNPDVYKAWDWARMVGSDLMLFDSADEATLMTRYTGGQIHKRHAVFALNLQGGGGLELWQFKSRDSESAATKPVLGDLGIFASTFKAKDIQKAHTLLKHRGLSVQTELLTAPDGVRWFSLLDSFGNPYQVIEGGEWFLDYKHPMGGISGALIGVHNMEASISFYRDVLGFDTVVYDEKGVFEDLETAYDVDNQMFHRVKLKKKQKARGFFSHLVDSGQIELIQSLERSHGHIFEHRYWGDAGFIHLCFDVQNMDALKDHCVNLGYPFTVDSQHAFDMNEASGRFSYVEDPDGTLIEFVEAFKLPIIKKLGWYLHLEKRNPTKPLPPILFRAMGLSRTPVK